MYGKKVKLRAFFIILVFISALLITFLVINSLKENVVYFKSPTEIKNLTQIDKKKLPKTKEEKAADGYYHRFIRNLKKLMTRVGLGSKVATFAAALLLIKESTKSKHEITESSFVDENAVLEDLVRNMKYLQKNSQKNYRQLQEEIANATGSAVAGTGDDPVHWKKTPYRVGSVGDRKKKGRYINGVAYLKAVAKAKKERESGLSKT